MTDFEAWERGNDAFLAASLHWLRLRLRRMTQVATGEVAGRSGSASLAAGPDLMPLPASFDSGSRPAGSPVGPEASPQEGGAVANSTGGAALPRAGRPLFGFRRARPAGGAAAPTPGPTLITPPPPTVAPVRPALPAPDRAVTQAEIDAAHAAMVEAETAMLPARPALALIEDRLGLSRFERDVLLLCIAVELDDRISAWCAEAQGDPRRGYPTFALALALFEDSPWEALSPERPLRYWRLLEVNQPGAQPLTTSALRADERIVNFVKGVNYLDDRLRPFLTALPMATEASALPQSQQVAVDRIVRYLEHAPATSGLPVVQLVGADSASKRSVAIRAVGDPELHFQLYRIAAEAIPGQAGEFDAFQRLWMRESQLMRCGLYIDALDLARDGDEVQVAATKVRRLLAAGTGLFFLDVREVWPEAGRAVLVVDVAKPTPEEQEAAWGTILGSSSHEAALRLSSQFSLNLEDIDRIAQAELAVGMGETEDAERIADRLWQASLLSTRPRLDLLATRIDARATWEDIVLPDEQRTLLEQITAQVDLRRRVYDDWGFRAKMNRGLGISALFGGESGTGKTMAAEVIANALALNLYRIDLSGVVSKYIGQTEDNLRRLFDAAEDGGTILFFDEADALFGKRSEVRDSHDRYANIEINYLLQRMEAYGGLAILATNMKSALDQAFLRRLRFIVNFPFPGPEERRRIWEKALPTPDPDREGEPRELHGRVPVEGLDYARLAKLNVTGGVIHNIALNAAFLAARADSAVTMPIVLEAARTEYRKLEKPINEAEFRWEPPARLAGVVEPVLQGAGG